MSKFTEIDEARKLLGLGEEATSSEIRSAYRKLSFQHHPDIHHNADSPEQEEIMKKLNQAYHLLLQYCHDYKYSFREEDIARAYPYDDYLRKYYHGWFDGI